LLVDFHTFYVVVAAVTGVRKCGDRFRLRAHHTVRFAPTE